MANVKKYRTIPHIIHALRVHKLNIVQVANWCNGVLLEDPASTPQVRIYKGIDVVFSTNRTTLAKFGWFVVKRPIVDGGGFAVYSPEDFAERYEALA